MSSTNIIHVAVAVIKNQQGQIFIAKRPENSHQGGLWEFPGGKVESDETVLEALKRELLEEVGILLIKASPLIRIPHDYGDKSVLLDVWQIEKFSGNAFGNEGQETRWINKGSLSEYDFPLANLPIITAIQLPEKYMITGEFGTEEELLLRIQSGLNKNIKLIQFRANNLPQEIYFSYAEKIYAMCKKENAQLFLNISFENYKKYQAHKFSHGLHLNSKEIKLFYPNILDDEVLVSTSTHNAKEIRFAESLNIDFILLSPVNKTNSHPNSIPLGWSEFNQLTEKATIPAFALGGMTNNDLDIAKINGAQGIAAIGEFWEL